MSKKILTFNDIEIEKNKVYHSKILRNVDIKNVLLSNKLFSHEKL